MYAAEIAEDCGLNAWWPVTPPSPPPHIISRVFLLFLGEFEDTAPGDGILEDTAPGDGTPDQCSLEVALYYPMHANIPITPRITFVRPNSRVIRLTSPTPDGAYTREGTVIPTFSHNPQVLRTPDGGVAIYAIGNGTLPEHQLCRGCYNGTSNGTGASCPMEKTPLLDQSVNVWTASSVAGPFTHAGTLGMHLA